MQNLLLALALLLLAACGGEQTSEQYLSRAKSYFAKSDYSSATIELQNALQLDGKSAEARWLLGKIHLDSGDILEAEKELRRARGLGWKKDDVRPALAKTLLAQGKFADVLALDYQDLNPSAASQLLSSQVLAALLEGQADRANELLALALDKQPQSPEAKLAEATIAVYAGDPARAMNLIEAILDSTPNSGEAWRIKGHLLLQQGKIEEARAAFDQSIAHLNISFADRVARALINLQLQDYEAAQADARELIRLSPGNPAANYVQGLVHFQHQKYRDAITALTLVEPAAGKFPLASFYLSMAYLLEENDVELAARFAARYVEYSPGESDGRKLLAAILVLQNKPREAREVLRPAMDHNPDDVGALNIMANALLLDDQADQGIVLYARIAQLQPDWPIVPLRLEAGLITSNSDDEVSQYPDAAPDDNANFPQADILLILSHLRNKNFEGAIVAAESYKFRDSKSLAPYILLGSVYLAAGKPAQAREVFDKALKREPGNPSANLSLAQMAQDAGNSDTARRYYQTVLDYHPDDLATLVQLAGLEARQKKATAMIARLNQAVQAHPDSLEPRLMLARYYAHTGRPDKVEPLFAKFGDLQRLSPRVLELIALAQLSQQQYASARSTLQELVDAKPESVEYRYQLAKAASASGDIQKTRQELKEAQRLDATHVPTLIALANDLELEGNLSGAQVQYRAVLKEDPDNIMALNNLAWALRLENSKKALEYIRRASDLAPDMPAILDTLAVIEHLNGDNTRAHRNIQRALEGAPGGLVMRYHKAMIEAALGETEQAIDSLEELLTNDAGEFLERAEAEKLLMRLRGYEAGVYPSPAPG